MEHASPEPDHLSLERIKQLALDESSPLFAEEEWRHFRYCKKCLEELSKFVLGRGE
jgi:hypothetical protein